MSRAANSDEVGMSGRGPVGDEDISDTIDEVGEVSTPSRDDARLE